MFRLPPARERRDFRLLFLIFCFVGITGFWMMCIFGKTKNPPPSFPRKRESRILMRQKFIGKNRSLKT
ncbi:hypothetical protein E0W45_01315 [Neisseria meningitidis]|nr:hypothetical protein [Neisseria meningitidis]MBG8603759.1 hypothetical protein [Neisseria meningitidis]MBJ7820910.1 hypothetical protein [Neisseria meningitidis]MBJ7826388.1 hypothetical protein [Neisseria meningitidis]MBJ7859811.1 hypothetical protein [Neisseria meningitidis]